MPMLSTAVAFAANKSVSNIFFAVLYIYIFTLCIFEPSSYRGVFLRLSEMEI